MGAENAHAALPPSSAKRWINCPGSVALCAQIERPPTSEAAAQGSVAHAVAEELVTGRAGLMDLLGRVGTSVRKDGHDIEIDEEMVDHAVEYRDAVELDRLRLADGKRPVAVVQSVEVRVKADKSIDEAVWGTADVITYQKGNTLIVRDYKYGFRVVEPEENEQLATYACAVMDTAAGWAFDNVELVVFQPRAPHADGPERRWTTTTAWLKEFAARAKAAAAETRLPGAKIVPGDWCSSSWCPAQATCKACHAQAQEKTRAVFSDLPPETALATMTARLPEVRLMSDAQLVQAFAWEDTVKGFFSAVEAVLLERAQSGTPVPGTKLVEGKSNRQWTSEEEVERVFTPRLGARLWERKILSPAKLEKLLSKGEKKDVDALTFKPEGKKSVALDRDPRPVARSSAQEAFTGIAPDPVLAQLSGPGGAKNETVWPQ